MTEETNAFYEAVFALEEVRELLRETAPEHKLSDEQKIKLKQLLEKVKKNIEVIEGRLG